MPITTQKKGKKIPNIARSQPISENYAKAISDSQIWAREFNADYDQIMLRISNAPTGLRFGAPPGTVT